MTLHFTDQRKTESFDVVLGKELEGMAHLRGHTRRDNLVGLAFSGGGIRSATLNLGILQGLARKGLLDKFDYLSTVSGGGYIGAWFSSLIKHNNHINTVQAELIASTLPHSAETRKLTAAEKAIQWLRSYSNYLTPKTGLFTADTLAAIAQWMTNTLLNQVLLAGLLVSLMMAVIFVSHSEIHSTLTPAFSLNVEMLVNLLENAWQTPFGKTGAALILISLTASFYLCRQPCLSPAHATYPILAFLCGVCGIASLFWPMPSQSWQHIILSYPASSQPALVTPNLWIGVGVPVSSLLISTSLIALMGISGRLINVTTREWWHRIGGINIGFCTLWLALFGFALYLPYWIDHWLRMLDTSEKSLVGIASWLFAFLTSRLGKSETTGNEAPNSTKGRLIRLLPYMVITLILLVSGYLSYSLYLSPHRALWFATALLIVVIGSWRIDINVFSLHNFYRNRLTRCFLGATNLSRKPNNFTGFDSHDDLAMSALRGQRPTHIVNTALNISDGSQLAWQERKAASFMFSPYYCGFKLPESEIWYDTHHYTGEGGPALGSLIATSGAAASPNMGYHTNPVMGFIMTIFNARLGRWFGNPLHENYFNRLLLGLGKTRRLKNPPERKSPFWNLFYLVKELITNTGLSSGYLYLSDGGHFENLGIYELVRRRCKLIVAVDGGADGEYEFEDLGNAIRKCKVDFGITITINIDALLPSKDCKYGAFKCGSRHFAIGRIDYLGDGNPDHMGYLVYIKSSLTGDEPADLINFKLQEPSFPHHNTVDQFFNESQFESYRRLGEHIVQHLNLATDIANKSAFEKIQQLMPGLISMQAGTQSPDH
ncbi:patatin-like phospholipase family protein [Methylophilus aquaticus]|uniref:Patatin-like phospholipase family protein n=1 Tax=Methylophilus aquaticus TaxID=1971610 RepID=A0ABT9JUW5_9PROT|nr:patatin-like phospholipase family protein [Methylophilus aquaticus]MDP8568289.1 patatin-like phospholipase family protein [Methylophilus aquaticus]